MNCWQTSNVKQVSENIYRNTNFNSFNTILLKVAKWMKNVKNLQRIHSYSEEFINKLYVTLFVWFKQRYELWNY